MIFFCNDLIGHNTEIKGTYLTRLVECMGDGEMESHSHILNNVGGERDGEDIKIHCVPTKRLALCRNQPHNSPWSVLPRTCSTASILAAQLPEGFSQTPAGPLGVGSGHVSLNLSR